MVGLLASSAVNCRFVPVRVKPKPIKWVFVASLLAYTLSSKSKHWLAWNQGNVSE